MKDFDLGSLVDHWIDSSWDDRLVLLDSHRSRLCDVPARDLLIDRVRANPEDTNLARLFQFHCRLLEGGLDHALAELALARALWAADDEDDVGRLSRLLELGRDMVDRRPTSRWIIGELLSFELPFAAMFSIITDENLSNAPQTGFRDTLLDALAASDGQMVLSMFQAGPTCSELEHAMYTIPLLRSVVAVVMFNADLGHQVPAVLDMLAEPSAVRRHRLSSAGGDVGDLAGETSGLLRRIDLSLGYLIETNLKSHSSNRSSRELAPFDEVLSDQLAQRWAVAATADEMTGDAARMHPEDPAQALGDRQALIYLLPGMAGGVEPVALRVTKDMGVEVFPLDTAIFDRLVAEGLLAKMMSDDTDTPGTVSEVVALTSAFLAPVLQRDFVDWADEVVFIADSLMALLPCHVVSSSKGEPLAADVLVRYGVSGASATTALRGAGRVEGAVVLPQPSADEFDGGLLLAEAEAEVMQLLGYGQARPTTADQLALTLAVAPQAHVIDHGQAAAAPAGSRIGPSRLAEVTALDLAFLPTNTARRQLTLSSCWGGPPQIVPTPVVPGGMRGAARIAGFDRLVASMWPVREDAAFVFMLLWTYFICTEEVDDGSEADAVAALWQAQRMMATASRHVIIDAVGEIIDDITTHTPSSTALTEALRLLRSDARFWDIVPFEHPANWGAYFVCS